MNVGEYLKRERETKSIPLDQIADITKISLRHLSAIEDGQFDLLPGKIYTKGFLKAYSKCIGLNPDDIWLRYETTLLKPTIKSVKTLEPSKTRRIKIGGTAIFIVIMAVVFALAVFFSSR